MGEGFGSGGEAVVCAEERGQRFEEGDDDRCDDEGSGRMESRSESLLSRIVLNGSGGGRS